MSEHPVAEALITARNLQHSFGETLALRGVDVDVEPGEILAVMGPSGSGKSTLLHILAGVLVPDEGSVVIGGRDIATLGEAQRSNLRLNEFGFIFQFGQLLPDLSAVHNVSMPLLLQGVPRKKAVARAAKQLAQLGLGEHLDSLPSKLSGGQSQRVAIARAIVTGPKVLFADEPTGSLDSLTAEQVMETLTRLSQESGTTVVIITHDPRTAAWADREVMVRDGAIVGQGALL